MLHGALFIVLQKDSPTIGPKISSPPILRAVDLV